MKTNLSNFLNVFTQILLGLFIFSLPFIFTTLTTDNFALPKQFALAAVCLLGLVVYGVKSIAEKTVRFRKTPLNPPIFLFAGIVFLSSLLSLNKAESLVAFSSLLFAVVLFFLFVNFVKTSKASFVLTAVFFESAVALAILSILTFFKVYILPFGVANSQTFSPIGALLDQAVYIFVALGLGAYFIKMAKGMKMTKVQRKDPKYLGVVAFVGIEIAVLLIALGLSVYGMLKIQNPLILPFLTGFQIGFAAISQDTQRAILSFLLGSGFGTFGADFARFKLPAFNSDLQLWNLTFFRSSSFILELLATTGVLGVLSFFLLIYKFFRERPLFYPLLLIFVLSFVLPFSATLIILLFVVLGIFSSLAGLSSKEYYDLELGLVTLKSGLVTVASNERKEVKHGMSGLLTWVIFLLIIVVAGLLGVYSLRYAMANFTFQKSLSSGNATQVYQLQSQALDMAPYNDAYQRIFSQTNLSLANSLSQQSKESSPSAQTQQTIYTLIQQSINSARVATGLSPLTSANWQNLSSIYRSLIGFGKNADQFAILASQQSVSLDPNNPQEYINLGGLYYQLKDWNNAQQQFLLAINLKPDFANAHYNLAHALQEKGDTQGALGELEVVKQLVKNDPTNLKKIQSEIDLLKNGLNTGKTPAGAPKTELPPQNPPIAIPAPATPTPTPLPSSGQATPKPTTAPLQ